MHSYIISLYPTYRPPRLYSGHRGSLLQTDMDPWAKLFWVSNSSAFSPDIWAPNKLRNTTRIPCNVTAIPRVYPSQMYKLTEPSPRRGLAAVHGSPMSSLLKIVLIWLVGYVLAVLHHVYNSQLNDRAVRTPDWHRPTAKDLFFSQQGTSAVGTTLANLASAAMAASTAIAFFQCAWSLVRCQSFTVAGLDALWYAPGSQLSFLELDFVRTAKGVVLVVVA
ncbi:hypothetical protein DFH09DRAFT_1309025 [Mycena vulgaris]|nr:hypothetical protein DFH09DRAFT_1309025 [Mycena vulgaris]